MFANSPVATRTLYRCNVSRENFDISEYCSYPKRPLNSHLPKIPEQPIFFQPKSYLKKATQIDTEKEKKYVFKMEIQSLQIPLNLTCSQDKNCTTGFETKAKSIEPITKYYW